MIITGQTNRSVLAYNNACSKYNIFFSIRLYSIYKTLTANSTSFQERGFAGAIAKLYSIPTYIIYFLYKYMFRYQYLQVRNTYYRDIYSMCNTTVECNCINIQKNAAVIKLLYYF